MIHLNAKPIGPQEDPYPHPEAAIQKESDAKVALRLKQGDEVFVQEGGLAHHGHVKKVRCYRNS